jgi:hypothetical protein
MSDKRFIVRKYVNAPTAAEAIQRESAQPVDEVYLESPEPPKGTADGIGFHAYQETTWRQDEIIARKRRK